MVQKMITRRSVERETNIRIVAISSMWTLLVSAALLYHGVPWIGPCLLVSLLLAAIVITKRDTWLPFLGTTVFPPGVLRASVPKVGMEMDVPVRGGAQRVVYWAATPGPTVRTPEAAYDDYSNSGVVDVVDGKATIVLQCPSNYYVKGRRLKKHVHYREVYADGLLGPVRMADVICS
jgi:hypothetical protein